MADQHARAGREACPRQHGVRVPASVPPELGVFHSRVPSGPLGQVGQCAPFPALCSVCSSCRGERLFFLLHFSNKERKIESPPLPFAEGRVCLCVCFRRGRLVRMWQYRQQLALCKPAREVWYHLFFHLRSRRGPSLKPKGTALLSAAPDLAVSLLVFVSRSTRIKQSIPAQN